MRHVMGTPDRTTLLVADDHSVVREGLVALLGSYPEFRVILACGDGETALQALRASVPDVALLDIHMPGLTGIDILASVAREGIKTKVIFFVASITNHHIVEAIARGVKGITLKDTEPDELVKCIREVVIGKSYFPR